MKEARAELVRIDKAGVVHPIGTIASQRLRAREGAFRLLPAPPHLVLMRYTGEDGRRDAEDGAVMKLAGEITQPAAMCDVLAMLSQTGWRGELMVLDGDTSRSIFFDKGSVVGAQTSVEAERLGMILYRFGRLTPEQHEQVVQRLGTTGRRFGECAVELGFLSTEQVYTYMSKQVEEIVFSTLTVSDGTFFFLEGFDDTRLGRHVSISVSALLMDGVTRMDELRYFRQRVPSSDYVPVKVEGRDQPPAEFAKVYEAIDGEASVEELGRRTNRGEFETTKAVYALIQSRHVAVQPPRLDGGGATLVVAANHALRLLFQAVDAAGQGTQVRQNLASFAAGAGVYELLFRGSGPDAHGCFEAEAMVSNAALVAGGVEPQVLLRQLLHEYVGFALFAAGSALGAEREVELSKDIGESLSTLGPTTSKP